MDTSTAAAPTEPRLMKTPREIYIEITAKCNLRCRYCYYRNNPAVEYRDLPTGEWLAFFDELGRCSVMTVCLAGGEPFARHDIAALIDGIVANRMRYSILTNGGLIDDAIAAHIASTRRCDMVQVSIDGSRAETHDACRGSGSFDEAVRGLRILQHHGVPISVRVTIHRYNVDDLSDIARFLLDELGLREFSTNSASEIGACGANVNDLTLTIEQRAQAMASLLQLRHKYDGRIGAAAGPLAQAITWSAMIRASQNNAPPSDGQGYLSACGGPTGKLVVRSDGTYVPCCMLAHVELGHINLDALIDVWRNSPALHSLRQRVCIPLRNFESCRDCAFARYCTGDCTGLAYNETGRLDHPALSSCLRTYLDLGGRLP